LLPISLLILYTNLGFIFYIVITAFVILQAHRIVQIEIIGNSSAGIREAPYYNVPTVDIGTRQKNRASLDTIFNCSYQLGEILEAIKAVKITKIKDNNKNNLHFGIGESDKMFLELLNSEKISKIRHQKQFQDI
jgi:UDP-N-acetylglucosamine 2-epimerase (hydrolysing)